MDCEKRILGILNTKDCAASLGLFKTRNRIVVLSAGIEPALSAPQAEGLSIDRRELMCCDYLS